MTKRQRQISLGLSIANLGYHYAAWRHPDVPADGNMRFSQFANCARLAEAGKFDLIFLTDSAAVRDLDNTAIARELEHQVVKHEPRVGFVPTASVTYNEPYNLTRMLATLDHLSHGRIGWNMVTSFRLDEARNFGLDAVLPSEVRHERAHEFLEVMKGLLDRWDDDGFPRDKASGVFFERMHRLEHRGKHFNVRDPLDVGPIPQRHIPIFTAGDSANSQELAARHADVVYGGQPDLASARTYYASLMGRLARRGRTPDELLVMPGIMPFIGRTMQEAQDKLVHHQCRRRLQYPGALHPRGREGFRRAGDPRAAAPRPVPH